MKDSYKAIFLIFMVINAFTADLTINKKAQLGEKGRKILKSSSKFRRELAKAGHLKSTFKSRDPVTGVAMGVYLITKVIDGITSYFNSKAQALEDLVKDLKNKNLATLAVFRDTIQEMKNSLCNNIRNSNFFFFDYLTYFIIDLYFRRKQILTAFKNSMLIRLKKKYHLMNYNFKAKRLGSEKSDTSPEELKRLYRDVVGNGRNGYPNNSGSKNKNNGGNSQNNGSKGDQKNNSDDKKKEEEKKKQEEEKKKQDEEKKKQDEEKKNDQTDPKKQDEEEKPKEDESAVSQKLASYDNLSQSLFAVKQTLKSFQNTACKFDQDIIDEVSYIRARSEGIAISLNEDTEGSFFYVAKIVLDFGTMLSDVAYYAAQSNQQDFATGKDLTGSSNVKFADQDKFYQEYKNRMGRLTGLGMDPISVPAENYFIQSKYKTPYIPYLENPYGFIKDQWAFVVMFFDSIKELSSLALNWIKGAENKDAKARFWKAAKGLCESLLNLAVTVYLVKSFYEFIEAVKGKGDFFTGFGNAFIASGNTQSMAYSTVKIPLQLPPLVVSVFDYIIVRNENIDKYYGGNAVEKSIAGAKLWVSKKKLMLQVSKMLFLFVMNCLGPYLMVGMVRLLKELTVQLVKSGWSATSSATAAANMVVNVVFVLKIFISLMQLVLAILRYIKAKRIAKDVQNDFYGEKRLRDNMMEQLKIQIIFVTFKYNSLLLQSFQDILKFYETVVLFPEVSKEKVKHEDVHHGGNSSKEVKKEMADSLEKIVTASKENCTVPTRYNNLDTKSFFIKLCQENETYCSRHLTPSILINIYKLTEQDAETVFKISYNDLIAGPISDVYVATPGSTLLSEPYLDQGNWKFYRKNTDKPKPNDVDLGSNYAILYRRCGNALNYLEGVSFNTVALPGDLYKIFEQRQKIVEGISEKPDTNTGYIINSFFANEMPPPGPGANRKIVYFTLSTAEGIDKLRGDDKRSCKDENKKVDSKQTQRKIIFSLDKPTETKVYDFSSMTWEDFKCGDNGDFTSCPYLFSFIEGGVAPNSSSIVENVVLEYYENPCYKTGANKLSDVKKVFLAKKASGSETIYAKATLETMTHVNLYDQRFYGRSKICYGNFDRLDKGILKIDQNYVNINSLQYLESQVECYDSNKKLSIQSGMSEAQFIFSSQVNLLKTRIHIIRSEVCEAYVLFKPDHPIGNDTLCTKATKEDFSELGIFFCDKDNKDFNFFKKLIQQYGFGPNDAKIYKFISADEKNQNSRRELLPNEKSNGNVCENLGKDKFYFYNINDKKFPNPTFFLNMVNSNGENAFLFRQNSQFNGDDDNSTKDIPNLMELDKNLYDKAISSLIGEDRILIGRAGGAFHLVVPFSREITVTDPVSKEQKTLISDLVFRIDRKLQIALNNYRIQNDKQCEIKGNIFKVMLKHEVDQDAEIVNPGVSDPKSCMAAFVKTETQTKDETATTQSSKVDVDVQGQLNSMQNQMQNIEKNDKVEGFEGKNKPQYSLNPPLIEFAKPYKYMYVEFRLFEKVSWYEFLTADNSDYMNLSGMEFLLDRCFILYWPKFQPTYRDLEVNTVQPEPTLNFYSVFNYSKDWFLVTRYWAKYDFHYTNAALDVDCAEEIKTIPKKMLIKSKKLTQF